MFWNVEADVICDAPHGAQNYAVGVSGMKQQKPTSHEPYGIWESHNQTVDPRSLYQAQLTDRMGVNALHGIVLSQQRSGKSEFVLFYLCYGVFNMKTRPFEYFI